jgi:hypothetical protein
MAAEKQQRLVVCTRMAGDRKPQNKCESFEGISTLRQVLWRVMEEVMGESTCTATKFGISARTVPHETLSATQPTTYALLLLPRFRTSLLFTNTLLSVFL